MREVIKQLEREIFRVGIESIAQLWSMTWYSSIREFMNKVSRIFFLSQFIFSEYGWMNYFSVDISIFFCSIDQICLECVQFILTNRMPILSFIPSKVSKTHTFSFNNVRMVDFHCKHTIKTAIAYWWLATIISCEK